MPRCSAMRRGTCASRSYGRYFSPHELNPKWTSAMRPAASRTKIGPLSRIHESSIGSGRISTPSAHRRRTSACCSGSQTMTTGSKAAIALATAAYSRSASSNRSPQSSLRVRVGHSIRHASCGSHSAGIERPSSRGVESCSLIGPLPGPFCGIARGRSGGPRSHLVPERPGDALEDPPADRAILPSTRLDLFAPLEVHVELPIELPDEVGVERHQVDLLIELGGARVEVCGADGRHE